MRIYCRVLAIATLWVSKDNFPMAFNKVFMNVTMTHDNFCCKEKIHVSNQTISPCILKNICIPSGGNVGTLNKAFYCWLELWLVVDCCVIFFSCWVSFWCMLGGHHCGGLNEKLSLYWFVKGQIRFGIPRDSIMVREQWPIMVLTTCIDMSKFIMSQYQRKCQTWNKFV